MAKKDDDGLTADFMRLMRAGDHDKAFKMIYLPAKKICRGSLRTLGIKLEEDMEDVFQQVMLELFTSAWARFNGDCSILTFVYNIAYKRGVDLLRRRRGPAASTGTGAPTGDGSRDAEDPMERVEDLEAIDAEVAICARRAAAELREQKPKWWEMLLSRTTEASSDEELAEAFGLSHGSFRNVLSQARKLLAELCRKHCGADDCTAVGGA